MKEPAAIVFRVFTPSANPEFFRPQVRAGISSYNFQSYALDRIRQVFAEADVADWDDEGAKPVLLRTLLAAEKLVQAFPPLTSKPAVFAQGNGKISFQWMSPDISRDAVMVSVDALGGVSYATNFANGKKTHGAEIFSGTPPRDVMESVLHRFVEPSPKTAATAA